MKDKVLELIQQVYKCNYIGNLQVTPLNTIGYKVSIPLSCDEKPFTISIEANDEDFLKLLKCELKEASLTSVEWFIFQQNNH